MIKASEVHKHLEQKEKYERDFFIKKEEELFLSIDKQFNKQILYLGDKTKYKINILLGIEDRNEFYLIPYTRDYEKLIILSESVKNRLENSGWKNIKIKISNPWYPLPFCPKLKITIEK